MDKTVRCVAIDDEPLALQVIEKFCRRIGGIELRMFTNPSEGLEHIISSRPDLVFLDIEMGEIDGLYIAGRLPEGTCFIFTTAYLHYTLDGFDLDAVDYLHKPFSFNRFETAFGRAMRRLGLNRIAASGQSVVVRQEYDNISIPVDDILYIEAMEGYSKIYRVSAERVMTRKILKKLLQLLPGNEFIRIHRSYIVPRSKIKSFSKQDVCLINDITLPIGRQYAPEIATRLMDRT